MGVIHKFKGKDGGFDWEGISCETYVGDATKREVISQRDGANNFAIRYFEVAPGRHTSLDSHPHDHGVIVVRGKGAVLLGTEKHEINYGDAIDIPPLEIHQFENNSDEPLGFICVIPTKK